jgi:Sulfate permease and related transporters (MFS superfamily)
MLFKGFAKDFLASWVVFLVALPLCMGIALASGLPAASGILTGIIGGLVVASLSGSPMQVSGPAAGLASSSGNSSMRTGWTCWDPS